MRLHEIVLILSVLTAYALCGPVLIEVIRTNMIGAVNKTNRQLLAAVIVMVAMVTYLATAAFAQGEPAGSGISPIAQFATILAAAVIFIFWPFWVDIAKAVYTRMNRRLFLASVIGIALVAVMANARDLTLAGQQIMDIPAPDQQVQMVSASSAVIEATLVTGQKKRVDAKDLLWLIRNDRVASVRVLGVIEDVGK